MIGAYLWASTTLATTAVDMCWLVSPDGSLAAVDRAERESVTFCQCVADFDEYGRRLADDLGVKAPGSSVFILGSEAREELAYSAVSEVDRLGLSYNHVILLYAVGYGALHERLSQIQLHGMAAPCLAQ